MVIMKRIVIGFTMVGFLLWAGVCFADSEIPIDLRR